MSKFLYPRDLYRSLHKVWNASPFTTGGPPVALPGQKTLNQLLDVCYHASFLVEESRPVTFRAVFLEHTTQLKPLEAARAIPRNSICSMLLCLSRQRSCAKSPPRPI